MSYNNIALSTTQTIITLNLKSTSKSPKTALKCVSNPFIPYEQQRITEKRRKEYQDRVGEGVYRQPCMDLDEKSGFKSKKWFHSYKS